MVLCALQRTRDQKHALCCPNVHKQEESGHAEKKAAVIREFL